jgi:Xaa-Pro aminopeptidase
MDNNVISLRHQGLLHDEWLSTRLATVVPHVMERAGIDCWVLVAREYNEDPVVTTMLPATWLNARRRTILVFTAFGAERIAIARYAVGSAFPAGWSPETEPDQWVRFAEYLAEQNPQRIGINRSRTFALADGLSVAEYDSMVAALPSELTDRLVPTDDLAVGWLETRIPEEMDHYPDVCRRAHLILRRALSNEVVIPGSTTTGEVEWWLRQEVARNGYGTWFHPTASVQRSTASDQPTSFGARPDGMTIEPGDLVHIDFGIVYLGLHTDQQQHAYVLRPGETTAPAGLVAGLEKANRLQEIVLAAFQTGQTGNEILAAALGTAAAEGIDSLIYSHPIGFHGHGAGPTIGLWDQQEGVPGLGDYRLWPDTAYSIELSAGVAVPEWGNQKIRIMLEEDAFFDGDRIEFMDDRQTEFWLI